MTLTPSDRALILARIHDMDETGAAAEIADALGLDRDVRDLIDAALWEARTDGYNDGWIDGVRGHNNRDSGEHPDAWREFEDDEESQP